MKKMTGNLSWYGYAGASLLLVFALLASCPNTYEFIPVNNHNLTVLVPYPVKDGPVTKKVAETGQYTGKIEWLTETGPFTGSTFAAATVYTAVLTLSAKAGYTFGGVGANSFNHAQGVVVNPAGDGDNIELSVTITFPPTAAEGDTVVDEVELSGLFDPPIKNQALTTANDSTQYNISLQWQNQDGTDYEGPAFAPATVYKARLELTAKSGYTLSGVDLASFAYTGADVSATSVLDGGVIKMRITVTFPKTAGENENTLVNAFNLTSLITAPVKAVMPDSNIDAAQYSGSITWKNVKDDSTLTGRFATLTVYKAVIILTAKMDYTLEGVSADTFTYTGADAITNTAGETNGITVEITFPRTGWNLGYLEGSSSLEIKACCWYKDNAATLMIDNSNFNYWDYGWSSTVADNITSWDDLKTDVTFNGDECGKGHKSRLTALGLTPAHFFTLDLNEKKNNIVSFEFYPRDRDHMPTHWEVYISDSVEIGINPNIDGVTKLGEFQIDYPSSVGYVSVDLTQFNAVKGEALSGRYIQFRILADKKNGPSSEWIGPSGAEVRIGVDKGLAD
ncbi:MAG: hypothetical protein LBG27_13070 [Spirochaetaceae bacterium]|jgi:hypothetical protein|nr:hypothetical protein [Spirochaetaceae bacterium]